MASLEHVIRVSRIDSKEKDSFVFIHTSGATSDPINIRLLATEGEQAYVTTSELPCHFAIIVAA